MPKINTWESYENIQLINYLTESSWKPLFDILMKDSRYEDLEKYLNNNKKLQIYPYPTYVFHAFNNININNIHTVILGQDPYHNINNNIPQAMGIAFSVLPLVKLPSSLKNIFNNMKKYKHIKDIPTNGDLTYLVNQGCFLMNTSLTVFQNKPNSHSKLWEWFTDGIIEYLSNTYENLIFVLWGAFAYKKIKLIDISKHRIIISSHPSGLSCNKPMNNFPAFNDIDHFGIINEYLREFKKPILDFSGII